MKIIEKELKVKTAKNIELVNITPQVEEFVSSAKIASGLLTIASLHTTMPIIINEDEPGLRKDFPAAQKLLIHWKKFMRILEHNKIDNNAAAHISAGIIGSSANVIIKNGKMILGTWQNIFAYELDGPRERMVCLQIIGK